jgi:ketosteroid isomerase-like protein
MSEQSLEVVTRVYAAFAEGDVPAVLGAFADDIEWHEAEGMPYGGIYRGGEAVAQNVFGPISEDVEGFAVGDTVAVVVSYTGTGNVTGKPLDLPVVHVWDIEDGKAVRFRQFADTLKFADVVPAADSVAA